MATTAEITRPQATPQPLPDYRKRHQRDIPEDYRLSVFFGTTNAAGLAFMAGAAWQLDNVRPIEWLILPIAFLFSNFIEYWIHRGPLHVKTPPLELLFNRHTMLHHDYFRYQDMAFTRWQECSAILFPYWAIGIVILIALVPYSLLLALGLPNAAHLFLVAAVAYYLVYEWLHLAFHMPERYWIARVGFMRTLRRHHKVHHHKKLMQRYNFNITFPIFDWVFQTTYRQRHKEADAAQSEEQGATG